MDYKITVPGTSYPGNWYLVPKDRKNPMNMQIKNLSDKLTQRKIHHVLVNGADAGSKTADAGIRAAKLLTPDQTGFESGIIYIGRVSDLPEKTDGIQEAGLICIDDVPLPQAVRENPSLNLMLVDAEVPLYDLFNMVQDILLDSSYFIQSSAALLNSIIRGKGLQYIIEIGSELLGNPVMLGDSNHRVLAYSKCDDVTDGAWTELRDTGYSTYEYTVKYDFKRYIENSVKSRKPVIGDLGKVSRIRRIFSTVVVDGAVVGHLAVLEHNKPFTEKDLEITTFICDVLASEMQKNSNYRNSRKVILENLVKGLLDGSIKNEEAVTERIKYLKWKPKDKQYVLAVRYDRYEDSFGLISYMRDTLRDLLEEQEAVFYDNHIIFIIGCSRDTYLRREDFGDFIRFMEKNRLCAGISQEFTRITELKKYYGQALAGMAQGQKIGKEDVFFMYEEYAVHHIIDICCRQEDITDFCHPALLKLIAYDDRHHTDYAKSLFAYIVNMRNMGSTADALHIHRNTMSYRMGKIQEIIGLDLDNNDLSMNLFVSYKILEYGGKL
ncbi:PucR C-terminal helix-turn-helix domain-containing protein [Anaerobium acetethylicum]|uniref:PucR C-terminal helix-turn-helix domain-containing protein n=2 Tax=Anaerobium acetethylicum TaxID=1619234 RepID=A0A1D3TVM2_9FIRM|nr:PucR C-terminal helix-turn-helix domain-containing protein [Anaerobium acetethylicum]